MLAISPDNEFTFTAPIGYWRCEFQGDKLLTIRPIEPCREQKITAPHHEKWYHILRSFFDSKGKNIPHFEQPTNGTAFQQRVWHALGAIPAGTTRTYQELAAELNSGPRAVGQACRVNPYPLIIPCHRVIAKRGLGGYMGPNQSGLIIKQALLAFEQEHH